MKDSERDDVFPDPVPDGAAVPGAPRGNCENCGTPLLGEHCYACGQPIKGLVRHFSSVAGDFFDTVLNYDSRLPRTLLPLFARPGLLTREYFDGRRVRYVSPVRLFFTLSIVTFFFAQLVVSFGDQAVNFGARNDLFERATTVEEVIRQRDKALMEIADARREGGSQVPGFDTGLQAAETALRKSADARIEALQSADPSEAARDGQSAAERADAAAAEGVDIREADAGSAGAADAAGATATAIDGDREPAAGAAGAKTSAGDAAPVAKGDESEDDREDDSGLFLVDNERWDAVTNPIAIESLPRWANHGLNGLAARASSNIERMREHPDDFKDALLGAVPATLFVLLPVFALLLKLFYVFKRRLYMEHLIVALHSHAFLCLALLLVFVTMALRDAMTAHAGFWYGLLGWCQVALWTWMPVYLLLMQKRVYGQGWWMTLLKFSILGQLYLFLQVFGAVFAAMYSVVWG